MTRAIDMTKEIPGMKKFVEMLEETKKNKLQREDKKITEGLEEVEKE